MDDDKATEAYKKCETILAQTAANVYIQDMCELVAVRKGYTGYSDWQFGHDHVRDGQMILVGSAKIPPHKTNQPFQIPFQKRFFMGILITYFFGLILKLFTPGGFVSYETTLLVLFPLLYAVLT